MRGFVQLSRDDEMTLLARTDPTAFALLALIAARARYRVIGGDGENLKIGEAFIGDYVQLGFKTRGTYRGALKRLIENHHVSQVRTSRKGTVVRLISPVFAVIAYGVTETQNAIHEPKENQIITRGKPVTKKSRKKIKRTSLPYNEEGEIHSSNYPGFEKWYHIYPKGVGKQDALEAWAENGCEEMDQAKLINVLKSQMELEQWKKDKGQFIPDPKNYIRRALYNDDVDRHERKSLRLTKSELNRNRAVLT